MARPDLTVTFDIKPIVEEQIARARARVDEGFKEILREAFDAGHEKGQRTADYGRDEYGHFDEWLADFIQSNKRVF